LIAAPPVELAVSPPRLVVAVGETRAIRVTNLGASGAVIAASPAGYRIALRGRPLVLGVNETLTLRPRKLALAPGETATVAVTAPAAVTPGDHPTIVLLTRSPFDVQFGVRIRIGVLVLVRGPGRIVHRVVATALRTRGRALELWLRNDGNVSERLTRATVHVRLHCPVSIEPRELLPHTRGVVLLRAACRVAFGSSAVVTTRGAAASRLRVGAYRPTRAPQRLPRPRGRRLPPQGR
jgi:hypothetical protein